MADIITDDKKAKAVFEKEEADRRLSQKQGSAHNCKEANCTIDLKGKPRIV